MMPDTHDYSERYWGHDYLNFDSTDGGMTAEMLGLGHFLKIGDYLILPSDKTASGTTRYKIDEIFYYQDPKDMWKAKVSFAPRP